MRLPIDNPFAPGSDVVPQVWAGRTRQLNDWQTVLRPRLLAGLTERGRTILGEPGLGKSSLVRRIAAAAAREGDWVTPQIRVPLDSDPLKLVADAVLRLAASASLPSSRERSIQDLLDRVAAVAASGMSVTLRERVGPDPHVVLTALLIEIGRAAKRRGAACLVHIDEVQNITDQRQLSQLLIALGDALAHREIIEAPGGLTFETSLPIAVYLTGLPEFGDRAAASKGATFARRFQTTVLAAIDDEDLQAALQPFIDPGWPVADGEGARRNIRMTPSAVSAVIDLCRGEPFLFQLAGQWAWYAGDEDVITAEQVHDGWRIARSEAAAHVEQILATLPERERRLIEAMAALPEDERTLTRIASRAGFASASAAGTTSQRLDTVRGIIDRGRPYSFRHRAVEAYLTSDWPGQE